MSFLEKNGKSKTDKQKMQAQTNIHKIHITQHQYINMTPTHTYTHITPKHQQLCGIIWNNVLSMEEDER